MEQTWDPSIAPKMFNQYRNSMEIYRGFAKRAAGLRILDVGCAQGTLALSLAEAGHHVVAVDIRQQFLDYAASRYEKGDIRFLAGDVFTVEPGEKFDLIFVNQIIEHVVRPVELLGRAHSWLAGGGRAVVTTPNGRYLKNRLPSYAELGRAADYAHLEHTADSDGHFFAYLPGELREMFVASGFRNVSVRCFETPWISGHMKFRYLHRFVPYALLRAADRASEKIPGIGVRLGHQLLGQGEMG